MYLNVIICGCFHYFVHFMEFHFIGQAPPFAKQNLYETAACVRFLCRFVERFALVRQLRRLFNQIVEFFATFEHRLNGIPQNDFRFVQIVLDFGERIALTWILVFGQVGGQRRKIDGIFRARRPQCGRNFGREIVQHFRYQCVRHSLWILVVGYQNGGQIIGPNVNVTHIYILFH